MYRSRYSKSEKICNWKMMCFCYLYYQYSRQNLFLHYSMDWELLADQPLGHKLIKKWFWLYFFMIITAPVGYITKVIVSNTLSVEDVGIFYSVLWFVVLVSNYHDLGLTEALKYFLPKYRIEKKYSEYKTTIILTLIAQLTIGIIIAVGIYFWADWLAIHHFRSPEATQVIKTLCRYFIGINFVNAFLSVYTAFQDTIRYSILEAVRLYTILWFTLFFWLTQTLTVDSFSMAWIRGIIISLLITGIIFFKKYWHTFTKGKIIFSSQLIKTQLKYAFRVFLWINIWSLLGLVDQQIVINLLWPKAAGYYSNYFSLISTYSIIISPLLLRIFPIVTELITKNNHHQLKMLQDTLYKYFSVFALSMGGLFVAFWKEIAIVLFGTKFLYSGELLVYSWPFLIINVLYMINFGILAGLGKVKERVKVLWIALLVNVIINILLLYVFKIWLIWAVIAMIIWRIILRWWSLKPIQKHLKISFDWRFFIKNFIVIWVLTGIFFGIKNKYMILDNTARWDNIMYLLVAVVMYYIILAGINHKSIKLLIKEIKSMKK